MLYVAIWYVSIRPVVMRVKEELLAVHLPPTPYNVFLTALHFSPVSIIPPLLHTRSFIYAQPHII